MMFAHLASEFVRADQTELAEKDLHLILIRAFEPGRALRWNLLKVQL